MPHLRRRCERCIQWRIWQKANTDNRDWNAQHGVCHATASTTAHGVESRARLRFCRIADLDRINFSYTTPNLNLDQTTLPGVFALPGLLVVTSPTLIPGVGINLDLGNGPGIQEVSTFKVDISGADGAVAIAGAHGSVTGAAGGVVLRPFARLTSSDGDSVTTYGDPWDMQ